MTCLDLFHFDQAAVRSALAYAGEAEQRLHARRRPLNAVELADLAKALDSRPPPLPRQDRLPPAGVVG